MLWRKVISLFKRLMFLELKIIYFLNIMEKNVPMVFLEFRMLYVKLITNLVTHFQA